MKLTDKPNRLINEKSPYLLQHAHNPVDWYPWGEEAFQKAKAEKKPVFLSIGYSTCHWCHVMERESFEDEEVAALLNRGFVSIKVDREERPDLDHIYMTACQVLTGHGGWPLTVILTPDKQPFFAGTYFPKHSRHGLPGITELLSKLLTLWEQDEAKAREAGRELFRVIRQQNRVIRKGNNLPGEELLEQAYRDLKDSYDGRFGGFGRAPKFPVPHQLTFLLGYWKRTEEDLALKMVVHTLKSMFRGGIYDQIGYGFHRYSTDQRWLVPHFEKMLYDQALLVLAYLDAYQVTGDEELAEAARQVLEYVKRDLFTPEGVVCAAEDADTDGKEGLFYAWSRDEIIAKLGKERGELAADYYGAVGEGNFENGTSVLHRPGALSDIAEEKGIDPAELQDILEQCRRKLFAERSQRERPFRDDKVITGWNGLMMAALARGAAILDDPRYCKDAESIASFIKKNLTAPGGRLLRSYRQGVHSTRAFLDDYAYLIWGLMELYRSNFRVDHLEWAVSLVDSMLTLFAGDGGALNYSGNDETENLPHYQDAYDGATPSGNSVSALNLQKLGRITGRMELEKKGEEIIKSFAATLRRSPSNFAFMLSALDFALGPVEEVVIAGKTGSWEVEAMMTQLRGSFNPRRILFFHPGDGREKKIEEISPFIKPMICLDGRTTAYVCRNRSCLPPVTGAEELGRLLQQESAKPTGEAVPIQKPVL